MDELEYRRRNWDKNRWEEEISRDEKRIAGYFSELASCLDLPGEEKLIFETLKRRTNMTPVLDERDWKRTWCYFCDSEDDEDEAGAPKHEDEQLINYLDSLAAEWNLAGAMDFLKDFPAEVLAVSCAYARLLARAIDFVDSDPETEMELKISLGRRVISDLNEVLGTLERFRAKLDAELVILIQYHTRQLWELRNGLTEAIDSLESK